MATKKAGSAKKEGRTVGRYDPLWESRGLQPAYQIVAARHAMDLIRPQG